MSQERIHELLNELRDARERSLKELSDATPDEFSLPTNMQRWDDLRRILLRFGDHMREHANQIEDTRRTTDQAHTMPQRMLAEGEVAWGKLLAALVGLRDEDISVKPPDGGWSIEEVLLHLIEGENNYLNHARSAREKRE